MSDLSELKQRVESAVDRMASGQEVERQEHDSLFNLITELDIKYEARHKELTYCHTRIADLEKTNHQLGELLNTVVHLIETRSASDPSDPMHQASKMAADLANLFADSLSDTGAPDIVSTLEPETVTVEAQIIEDAEFVEEEGPAQPVPMDNPADDGRKSALKELFGDYTSELSTNGAAEKVHPDTVETSMPVETVELETVELETVELDHVEIAAPVEETDDEPRDVTMPAAAGISSMPESSGAAGMAFDEVSDEELEVESLLDISQGEPDYPDKVIAATDAARSNGAGGEPVDPLGFAAAPAEIVEMQESEGEEDTLDIPGVDNVNKLHVVREAEEQSMVRVDESKVADGQPDAKRESSGEDDIKALMSRLQQAAEKARTSAEEFGTSTRSGQGSPKADTG